jgi:hypothetical protein
MATAHHANRKPKRKKRIYHRRNQNEKNEFTIGVKFAGFVLIRVWQLITRIQKH